MKYVIILLIVTLTLVMAIDSFDAQQEWSNYKTKFSKKYGSEKEEKDRMDIFLKNKKRIDEHNAKFEKGEVTYKMNLNNFADKTPEELKHLGGVKVKH